MAFVHRPRLANVCAAETPQTASNFFNASVVVDTPPATFAGTTRSRGAAINRKADEDRPLRCARPSGFDFLQGFIQVDHAYEDASETRASTTPNAHVPAVVTPAFFARGFLPRP